MTRIVTGDFPKITVDVPFRKEAVQLKSLARKIKAVVWRFFNTLTFLLFQLPYRILTRSFTIYRKTDSVSYTHSYKINQDHLHQDPYVIFAFDGGGVRGKVILAGLKVLEKELGVPIVKTADCLAGVSTGGIIAGALSLPSGVNLQEPRYSAADVGQLYDQFAEQVFSRSILDIITSLGGMIGSKFPSPRPLLQKLIGDNKLSESLVDLVITAVDLLTGKVVLFGKGTQNYSELLKSKQIDILTVSDEAEYVDAGTSTSAAPTYFPSVPYKNLNNVDGGIANNSPALLAALLALSGKAKNRPVVVINFETGKFPTQPITSKESIQWGWIQWIQPLISYFINSNASLSKNQIKLLAAANPDINYINFQVTLENEEEAQMDNATPENLQRLEDLGEKTMVHWLDNGGREILVKLLKEKLKQKSRISFLSRMGISF